MIRSDFRINVEWVVGKCGMQDVRTGGRRPVRILEAIAGKQNLHTRSHFATHLIFFFAAFATRWGYTTSVVCSNRQKHRLECKKGNENGKRMLSRL
jgi:hypothetical protein